MKDDSLESRLLLFKHLKIKYGNPVSPEFAKAGRGEGGDLNGEIWNGSREAR